MTGGQTIGFIVSVITYLSFSFLSWDKHSTSECEINLEIKMKNCAIRLQTLGRLWLRGRSKMSEVNTVADPRRAGERDGNPPSDPKKIDL